MKYNEICDKFSTLEQNQEEYSKAIRDICWLCGMQDMALAKIRNFAEKGEYDRILGILDELEKKTNG